MTNKVTGLKGSERLDVIFRVPALNKPEALHRLGNSRVRGVTMLAPLPLAETNCEPDGSVFSSELQNAAVAP